MCGFVELHYCLLRCCEVPRSHRTVSHPAQENHPCSVQHNSMQLTACTSFLQAILESHDDSSYCGMYRASSQHACQQLQELCYVLADMTAAVPYLLLLNVHTVAVLCAKHACTLRACIPAAQFFLLRYVLHSSRQLNTACQLLSFFIIQKCRSTNPDKHKAILPSLLLLLQLLCVQHPSRYCLCHGSRI